MTLLVPCLGSHLVNYYSQLQLQLSLVLAQLKSVSSPLSNHLAPCFTLLVIVILSIKALPGGCLTPDLGLERLYTLCVFTAAKKPTKRKLL